MPRKCFPRFLMKWTVFAKSLQYNKRSVFFGKKLNVMYYFIIWIMLTLRILHLTLEYLLLRRPSACRYHIFLSRNSATRNVLPIRSALTFTHFLSSISRLLWTCPSHLLFCPWLRRTSSLVLTSCPKNKFSGYKIRIQCIILRSELSLIFGFTLLNSSSL